MIGRPAMPVNVQSLERGNAKGDDRFGSASRRLRSPVVVVRLGGDELAAILDGADATGAGRVAKP